MHQVNIYMFMYIYVYVYIRYVSLEGVPLTVMDMGLLKSGCFSRDTKAGRFFISD